MSLLFTEVTVSGCKMFEVSMDAWKYELDINIVGQQL